MHTSVRALRLSLVVTLLLALLQHNFAFRPDQRPTMTPRSTSNVSKSGDDSAVLRELKETIRKQAADIEALKKKHGVGSKAVESVGHGGGHGGGAPADDISSYLTKTFLQIAFQRVGWLSLFLMSLSLTALIMNGFEHTLSRQIELAYFVPLLAGHGGNTGGQTVGTVLSALSSGTVTVKDAPRVILKEAMSGLTVGCILGALLGPVAHYIMGISVHVATVVLCTLPLVSTIAGTLGSSIPFACVALGLDPSVIAGPAMTSFVDVSGLMSYFLIANQIFALFGLEL